MVILYLQTAHTESRRQIAPSSFIHSLDTCTRETSDFQYEAAFSRLHPTLLWQARLLMSRGLISISLPQHRYLRTRACILPTFDSFHLFDFLITVGSGDMARCTLRFPRLFVRRFNSLPVFRLSFSRMSHHKTSFTRKLSRYGKIPTIVGSRSTSSTPQPVLHSRCDFRPSVRSKILRYGFAAQRSIRGTLRFPSRPDCEPKVL